MRWDGVLNGRYSLARRVVTPQLMGRAVRRRSARRGDQLMTVNKDTTDQCHTVRTVKRIATTAVLALALAAAASCGPDAYTTISSPREGAHYVAGDTLWFHGEVNSAFPLDIAVEGDWRWTSDLDGVLGDRALFWRKDLTVGEHVVTLRVLNNRGLVLRDRVRFFVDRAP
jgi:hypothetical protein